MCYRVYIWVEKNLNIDFCVVVVWFLIEYSYCWLVGENLFYFNLLLINVLSEIEFFKILKEEMKLCI